MEIGLALALVVLYSTPPVESTSQCFRLIDKIHRTPVGTAILHEGNDFATVFDLRRIRIATVTWAQFDWFLAAHKLEAQRYSCHVQG